MIQNLAKYVKAFELELGFQAGLLYKSAQSGSNFVQKISEEIRQQTVSEMVKQKRIERNRKEQKEWKRVEKNRIEKARKEQYRK